jgi:arylsulfatase A-like enzyme
MKKFKILLMGSVILGWVFFAPSHQAAESSSRPNIIFILIDDLRVGLLSCEGHPVFKTPNIDRIANEGAIFKNAFVTTPICSPSRGSFLTGQYAHTHGILDNQMKSYNAAATHKLITFPRLLHDAGYESGLIGKWHMGNVDDTPRPGFDHWISFKGQGVYIDPELNINGKAQKVTGYVTDLLSDYAVDFVRQKHEKPFVLYLSHKAVHAPQIPAERHKDLYAGAKLPDIGSADDLKGKPAVVDFLNRKKSKKKDIDHASIMLLQGQLLASIDDGIKKLFDALEETKQLENTIIIFVGDNGYFLGEHGLTDKRWAYDESIRVPLLIRYPGVIKPGTTIDATILNIDIAPTLLEIGKAPIPENVEGKSFAAMFKGERIPWRDSAVFEYFPDKTSDDAPRWQALRTSQWKHVHYPEHPEMDELYDLKSDPKEIKNLILDETVAPVLTALRADLQKQLGM